MFKASFELRHFLESKAGFGQSKTGFAYMDVRVVTKNINFSCRLEAPTFAFRAFRGQTAFFRIKQSTHNNESVICQLREW
jgi:hypothetical protein